MECSLHRLSFSETSSSASGLAALSRMVHTQNTVNKTKFKRFHVFYSVDEGLWR